MFDNEYIFYGKHANMVNKLKGKLGDTLPGLFSSNYLLYNIAPYIGYRYKRKGTIDKSTDVTSKILKGEMLEHADEFTVNYRCLMMIINKDISDKEKIDIAFRLDDKDNERKTYDDIFNSYVLGGIEVLYEEIFEKDSPEGIDDYIRNLFLFVQDYYQRSYDSNSEDNDSVF